MQRREFITLLGTAVAIGPLSASAQEPGRIYRVAFLTPSLTEATVLNELRENGFSEGRNLEVLPGGFGVSIERVADVASSLAKASPDVIVTASEPYLRAIQRNTRSIPLIGMTEDMVGEGFVASLAKPDGNITGMSILSPELDGKRMEILIEAVPGVRKIALFADSKVTLSRHTEALRDAAQNRGVGLMITSVSQRDDVLPAIENAKRSGAEAICFLASSRLTPVPSFRRSLTCTCPPFSSGRRTRKKVPSSATVRGLWICNARERVWWSKFYAEQNRRTSRLSNRRNLNWSSILRRRRRLGLKSQPASCFAPTS
jgi:putative tryptophan/tyrosine transport system substrate-binding protein